MTPRTVLPGRPHPLGATWDGPGVNFALYAEHATAVELCLLHDDPHREERIALPQVRHNVWHGYVRGIGPGQRYSYRVHGPFQPAAGLRFNSNKLLLDPYAQAVTGKLNWRGSVYGYVRDSNDMDLSFDAEEDTWDVPHGVVVDAHFNWEGDRQLRRPLNHTVIYEMHVKGFTAIHPDIPPKLRGTYAGLAHPTSIAYLRRLGVTAVELLPVHSFVDEYHLASRGLVNYWGYNTLGYFAPEPRYASVDDPCEQLREFKAMVKELHTAGIEVILDVAYNHTCEGNEFGPTLSFRGLDNQTYYRLVPSRERYYIDYTGTGNTLNVRHPQVLKLIMDSLRYWVTEMHVDGFRFDLAAALARQLHEVDKLAPFFDIIHQDPVLSQVKLIAEPWDIGAGGYQVGNFPILWSEWNGKYRDTIRRFWRGDESYTGDLASRLTGSSDLYGNDGRSPTASINFVTAHDGFTLWDLVSYNLKHNEANREGNRDGTDANYSWNYGAEGPTSDKGIVAVRRRQQHNFLATLLLSQGVPMICGGDEINRTQKGNNNAYCQDNHVSWHDWNLTQQDEVLYEFTRCLIRLRKRHPSLRRTAFFRGRSTEHAIDDVIWLRTDGNEMTETDWSTPWIRSFAALLPGEGLRELDNEGRSLFDDTFLILLNAHRDAVVFTLPESNNDAGWLLVLDSMQEEMFASTENSVDSAQFELAAQSMVLLRASSPSRGSSLATDNESEA